MARTDTDSTPRTNQFETDPQEQARDILAQWRSHTLAGRPNSLTGPEEAVRVAEVFKVLSDPTRRRSRPARCTRGPGGRAERSSTDRLMIMWRRSCGYAWTTCKTGSAPSIETDGAAA